MSKWKLNHVERVSTFIITTVSIEVAKIVQWPVMTAGASALELKMKVLAHTTKNMSLPRLQTG